ncbi:DNA mismatch repair protein Mlh1-like protein [Zopfochytrium polystomum]|nr:DNA mismatch repair protein Mlh1-like protein [Zopfochytrium polystomum]
MTTLPEGPGLSTSLRRPIRRLDEAVVNRIAAGEIIQRPANAAKELLENSLDAQASSISLLVRDAGLKLFQIQDNGTGIPREDLPRVCERFATSKLRSFEELESGKVSTFGFRGEALASISHVAHVVVTTRTREPGLDGIDCAWRACYSDGVMVPARGSTSSEPKPVAGNPGTQITFEDLFFNVPTRRKALKSVNEEYARIIDVVQRYAIHNSKVSFSCKKYGSNTADVATPPNATPVDNIRLIYGAAVAKELIPVSDCNVGLGYKLNGLVSNANYNMKKMTFLLFINNRAVDCSNLKRSLESLYSMYLPKGTHPFCYIALDIDPENVDVNVHPTKREVMFLNQDEIVDSICESIRQRLANANESRTFLAQTISTIPMPNKFKTPQNDSIEQRQPKQPVNKMVRTDSRMRTLESMLGSRSSQGGPSSSPSHSSSQAVAPPSPILLPPSLDASSSEEFEDLSTIPQNGVNEAQADPLQETVENMFVDHDGSGAVAPSEHPRVRPTVDVQLTSILELRRDFRDSVHPGMMDLFREHTFVGLVDHRQALIQYKTKMFIVNYEEVTTELFYQLALRGFSNFGFMNLKPALSIPELVIAGIEEGDGEADGFDPNEIAKKITELLVSRRDMLLEYFSFTIDEKAFIVTLPVMLKGYEPNLAKLPMFLLRLGTEVDWETEEGCFRTLSREFGFFYSCDLLPPVHMGETTGTTSEEYAQYRWSVEHVVFKALRQWFYPSQALGKKNVAIQIADLPELYKVFERC